MLNLCVAYLLVMLYCMEKADVHLPFALFSVFSFNVRWEICDALQILHSVFHRQGVLKTAQPPSYKSNKSVDRFMLHCLKSYSKFQSCLYCGLYWKRYKLSMVQLLVIESALHYRRNNTDLINIAGEDCNPATTKDELPTERGNNETRRKNRWMKVRHNG